MIGSGGLTLIGQYARMKMAEGKNSAGAPWKITAAEQRPLGGPKWWYTLVYEAFGNSRQVAEDDDVWELTQPVVTKEEKALRDFLQPRMAPAVQGMVKSWLQADETLDAVSPCVLMDNQLTTEGQFKYLWSGGAADCVIVAIFSKKLKIAYLTHATRNSSGALGAVVDRMGLGAKVYLSCAYFGYGVEQASAQGTVQEIVGDLMREQAKVVACYGTGSLAINGRTGAVLSHFPKPRM